MKVRRIAGLLSVVVAASLSYAQDAASPEINTGSKALLFTFSGLNTLGAKAYDNGIVTGIGGKYYIMSPIALRASLAFGMASQDNPAGVYGSNSAMTFGISVGGEYHLSFARVSPFVGGVLGFSTTSTKMIDSAAGADRKRENFPIAAFPTYIPGKALNIGGIGGVEFFITKELSLSAEYQLGWRMPMGYEQKTTSATTAATTTTKVKVPGLSEFGISNSGALTLAVYF
jgi:hypothetical protein